MRRTTEDKLRSNVATLANELDGYPHTIESIASLATRICELAGGHTTRLTAADALAEAAKLLLARIRMGWAHGEEYIDLNVALRQYEEATDGPRDN